MKRIDRTVMLVVVLLATIAPMAFAGVARFTRADREADLLREQQLVADFARKIDAAQWQHQLPTEHATKHWRLLDGAEVTVTLQALQALVDASGVTLVAAKPAPAGKGGRQTYLLAGNGRPEDVCRLLAGIERCERLIVVESGRITPRSEEQVDFELGLATYHRGGDE